MNGRIKIHRKIEDWGWYSEGDTMRVFFHILIKATHKPFISGGVELQSGQCILGRKMIAEALKIGEQPTRTALERLKSTNEITIKSTNRFSIITVVRWEDYQSDDKKPTNKSTSTSPNKQPTENEKSTTIQEQHIQEQKNIGTILEIALDEFYEYRKGIKKPMKEKAKKLLNTELDKLAGTDDEKKVRLLNNAILKGRLSVYPEKGEQPIRQLTELEIGQLWENRFTPEGIEAVSKYKPQLDKYTPEQLNTLRKDALLHFVMNA